MDTSMKAFNKWWFEQEVAGSGMEAAWLAWCHQQEIIEALLGRTRGLIG